MTKAGLESQGKAPFYALFRLQKLEHILIDHFKYFTKRRALENRGS